MNVFFGILFGVLAGLLMYSINTKFLFFLATGGLIGYLLGKYNRLKFRVDRLQYQMSQLVDSAPQPVRPADENTEQQSEEKPEQEPGEPAVAQPAGPAAPHAQKTPAQELTVQKPVTQKQMPPEPADTAFSEERGDAAELQALRRTAADDQLPLTEPSRQHSDSTEKNPWGDIPPDALTEKIGAFFNAEHALLRIGIIILFIGVGFLIKYAVEENLFPVTLRLALVGAGALVLLGAGWRLRHKRHDYAMGLQGAGVGILYLDIIGTLKFTSLLPATPAFILLFLVCVFAVVLAVLQNSRVLAAMSAVGGYLAPVLTSTGSGDYILLFSYYLLLNTGILAIAWFKTWRSLNMVGFLFTFGVGLLWGGREYRAEMFWQVEFFLLAFFLQFVLAAVLFAIRQPKDNKGYVDASLVFGTPLIVFAIQASIVSAYEFGLALTALGLAAFYLLISTLFARTRRGYYRLFGEATLGLGIGFATLAIPLAVDGRWTSAAWALEGCAILWVGIRQQQRLPRLFGVLLQLLSGGAFILSLDSAIPVTLTGQTPVPVFNSLYLGALLIFLAGLITALLLHRQRRLVDDTEYRACPLLLLWSLIWWFGAGLAELIRFLDEPFLADADLLMLFISASAALFYLFARRARLPALEQTVYLIPLSMLAMLVHLLAQGLAALVFADDKLAHPFVHYGYLSWPVTFGLFYIIFRLREKHRSEWKPAAFHTLISLTAFFVSAEELSWHAVHWLSQSADWSKQTWLLVTTGLLGAAYLAASVQLCRRLAWPCTTYRRAYLYQAPGLVGVLLVLWLLVSTFLADADPAPLDYLPLLNPLELAQACVLLAIAWWLIELKKHGLHDPDTNQVLRSPLAIGVLLFIWINSMIVRTLGHRAGIAFELEAMLNSALAQASFSILWTLAALITMIAAARLHYRRVWFSGFALLALVILKLVLVDLSNSATLWRIISFIGVGVLLLLISYFAPLPPRCATEKDTCE